MCSSFANRGNAIVGRFFAAGALLLALVGSGCGRAAADWKLTDIRGHLPDLAFTLQTADRPVFSAGDLRGKVTLLFFGYAHCPDVCPLTMARLGTAVRQLGDSAPHVRILFVSVDPKRDSPALLQTYAAAFSPQAIGATGTPAEIETLAKRYRVAYQALPPDAAGNYEVMHSKAVYVFDRAGRARLLIEETDPPAAIAHDLKQLLSE